MDNQWSQITIVLQQRSDAIPGLVEIVSAYAGHEQQLMREIAQARSHYAGARNMDESVRAASEMSGALGRLMAVAESYPELKANENFSDLQHKFWEMEAKIADFRQFYNDTVMRYNRQLLTFPSSLIAGMFHFQQKPFFQADPADQEKPEISFSGR